MVATVSDPTVSRTLEIALDPDALAEVERHFREQLSPLRLFPGAALAVYHRGELVLDLVGGYADTQRGELVGPTRSFPSFLEPNRSPPSRSGSRSSAGRLDLDEPVATSGRRSARTARIASWSGISSPIAAASRRPRRTCRGSAGEIGRRLAAVAAMPLEHEPGDGQRVPLPDPALGLRRAGAPARWPSLPGLPARGDHRSARDGRYLCRPPDRTRASGRQAPRDGRHRRMGAATVCARCARSRCTGWSSRAPVASRPPGHGAFLRRDRGWWGTGRRPHPASGDGRRGCSRSKSMARSIATFDVPVRRGSASSSAAGRSATALAGGDEHRAHLLARRVRLLRLLGRSRAGLAMAFLSNGVRRDEAGAIARRDLSDAVRAAFR